MNRFVITVLLLTTTSLSIMPVLADNSIDAEFAAMVKSSFRAKGIATLDRLDQTEAQKACSNPSNSTTPEHATAIMKAEIATVVAPADGKYLGDWKSGEKIAISGKGMTWSDKSDEANGGGCYNCHQMAHKEISYGTLGPSLTDYLKVRGNSEASIQYTWAKIWNAKAYNACSNMPRFGDAAILTEQQMKDVMAFLYAPESPVNKK